MENDSDNKVITEDSANKTKLNAADQSSVDSLNFSTVVTQQSRNRNNSTDSGNSNRSGRDFSPASDDDP
ncbi:jg12059, partial [Pararge aegeria aegeria]